MTRSRWMIAGAIVVTLAALVAWQQHRVRLMEACLSQGRTWNGPRSQCEPPRIGPILRRSLERS